MSWYRLDSQLPPHRRVRFIPCRPGSEGQLARLAERARRERDRVWRLRRRARQNNNGLKPV